MNFGGRKILEWSSYTTCLQVFETRIVQSIKVRWLWCIWENNLMLDQVFQLALQNEIWNDLFFFFENDLDLLCK